MFVPALAADPVYFNIPEPQPDYRTFYFLNDAYLFEFNFLGSVNQAGDDDLLLEGFIPYDIYVTPYQSGNDLYFRFTGYNYTMNPVDVICNVYNTSGTLTQQSFVLIQSASYVVSSSSINELIPSTALLRSSNRTNVTCITFNCKVSESAWAWIIGQTNVIWNNDSLEHTDFTNIRTLLNNIYTLEGAINTNIEDYYDLMSKFLEDFFYEDNIDDNNAVIYNWAYYVSRFNNFTLNMMVFARDFNDWYHSYYIPKTDETNYLLEQILDYLTQEIEEVTINDDMSSFDEMESARDDLQVTDQNGSVVNAADQAEVVFSEAASGLDELSPAVLSVNNFINDFIFGKTILLIPLIVGLALGLIVTILGKNKSDV